MIGNFNRSERYDRSVALKKYKKSIDPNYRGNFRYVEDNKDGTIMPNKPQSIINKNTILEDILTSIKPNIKSVLLMSLYKIDIPYKLMNAIDMVLKDNDYYYQKSIRSKDAYGLINYLLKQNYYKNSRFNTSDLDLSTLSEYDSKYKVVAREDQYCALAISPIDMFRYKGNIFILTPNLEGTVLNIRVIGKTAKITTKKIFRDYIISNTKMPIKTDVPIVIGMSRSSSSSFSSRTISLGKNYDDVISPEKAGIVKCIDGWIKNRKLYEEFNRVYKLGILLHGKPGTGKTSLIKMLASIYNANIITMNASNITENEVSYIHEVSSNDVINIIVFEEVDSLFSNRAVDTTTFNSKTGKSDVYSPERTRQILLNLIDGLNTSTNTIFIATTNHYDKLDEAFVRDGRFDLKIEMKYFDEVSAREFCDLYKVKLDDIINPLKDLPISPATLENQITQYIINSRLEK